MYMVVSIDNLTIDFTSFVDEIHKVGEKKNLKIECMHEDIFNLMHKI